MQMQARLTPLGRFEVSWSGPNGDRPLLFGEFFEGWPPEQRQEILAAMTEALTMKALLQQIAADLGQFITGLEQNLGKAEARKEGAAFYLRKDQIEAVLRGVAG